MGLFFYNKIGSIISIVDLPTTNIIESKIVVQFAVFLQQTFHSHKLLTNFFLQGVTINVNQHGDIFMS